MGSVQHSGPGAGQIHRLHFDIGLDTPPGGDLYPCANHRIRKTLLHPTRSSGYEPLLGPIPSITMSQGFSVSPMDHHVALPIRYTFNNNLRPSPLMFAYVLEGKRCYEMKNRKFRMETRAGQWYAGFIPEVRGEGVLIGSPKIRSLKFRFDPLALYNLLEGEVAGLPDPLSALLRRLDGEIMTIGGRMSPAMLSAAERLLQCPFKTPFQLMAYESLVLDLLGLHLEEIHDGTPVFSDRLCSKHERQLSLEAKNILIANLKKPPGMEQLSSDLGVSRLALKKSFERVFGISLHRYLQILRMEKARRILEQGHLNVNETAEQVGYTNISRFIDVFFKNYGVKPGEFMRQQRRVFAAYPWKA